MLVSVPAMRSWSSECARRRCMRTTGSPIVSPAKSRWSRHLIFRSVSVAKQATTVSDAPQQPVDIPTPLEDGYSVPAYRPPNWIPASELPGPTRVLDRDQGTTTHPGPTLASGEKVCDPHLQVLCGPLLRYDTVWEGVWKGAVLIVSECGFVCICVFVFVRAFPTDLPKQDRTRSQIHPP